MVQLFIYAITQAVTEYLPVSSSGHLAVLSHFFSFPDLFIFTTLHFASLIAVIIFFRKELWQLLRLTSFENRRSLSLIFLGILPAGIFGLLCHDLIEQMFGSMRAISIAYFISACFLFATKFAVNKNKELSVKTVLIIGCAQVAALLPGISRSGITISTGLLLGIEQKKAMTFSFLMYIPLAFAAFLKELLDDGVASINQEIFFPFIACIILSLICLKLLKVIIKKDFFWLFSIYCFAMMVLTFFISIKHV
ncbi:MAG: undecaprenyl-diphosphate phosphatase [Candidatus Omnitrophica bacterium]|nr:undecaprenyl-diphosphate phosphatase [Candidatus Omnitrophota bacterium]